MTQILRQAYYYPISLFTPVTGELISDIYTQLQLAVVRLNIRLIYDACIDIQLSFRGALRPSLHLYVDSDTLIRIIFSCSQLPEDISYSLSRRSGLTCFRGSCGCVYAQAGLTQSSVPLLLNIGCLVLSSPPARLYIAAQKQPLLLPDPAPAIQELLVQSLSFHTDGVNTTISYDKGKLLFTCLPGIGLGKHYISKAIYDGILTDQQLEAIHNKAGGLVSINGHTGDVRLLGRQGTPVSVSVGDSDIINVRIG